MSAVRTDLLHLSPEALAQAANAGVVKRALRELEGGYRPECALDDSGTLTASFPDGIRTVWAGGLPIQQVQCSCGATSVCRHRIIAALAYREAASQAAPAAASPGSVTDEALARLVPAALLELARTQAAAGLSVDIRRQAAGEPCDTARLPAATVRYWAGASIEAARCDCVRAAGCEHVALGVWAFRLADERQPEAAALQVRLGAAGERLALERAPYVALVDSLLRRGVAQGPAPHAQALSAAFAAARGLGAVWLDHLLADIEQWSAAYAQRSALYAASQGVAWVSELTLRLAAGGLPGNALGVLGIGQDGETELDRLRLQCLGARTARDGEQRRTRLVMADADTGTKLVLLKEWQVPQAQAAREAELRAAERLAPGVLLTQLAQGQLLAQHAKRLADGSVQLAKARRSQNSVMPQAADWRFLGAPLRFSRVAELADQQRAQPTAAVLPRHAVGRFVVFSPAEVEGLVYTAHEQTLSAGLLDAAGQSLMLRRVHEPHLPHALDAMAAACSGRRGPLRHVAGELRWEHGVPVMEPWAFACDDVVVPDFSGPWGALSDVALGGSEIGDDPVAHSFEQVRELLGSLLHHGLGSLPRSWLGDASLAVKQWRGLSLHALADELEAVAGQVREAQASPAAVSPSEALMRLSGLLSLHEDARVVLALEG